MSSKRKTLQLEAIEQKGRAKWLKMMKHEPVIFEMNDGDVIAGKVDGCEEVSVCLYDAHRLADDKSGWIAYDGLIASGDENQVLFADGLPVFEIISIERILRAADNRLTCSGPRLDHPSEDDSHSKGALQLDDMMKFYLNPDYVAHQSSGIECDWRKGSNPQHSKACDGELHEALTTVWTNLTKSNLEVSNNRRKCKDVTNALMTLRRHLLLLGARIP